MRCLGHSRPRRGVSSGSVSDMLSPSSPKPTGKHIVFPSAVSLQEVMLQREERIQLYWTLGFGITGFLLNLMWLELWSAIILYTAAAAGIGFKIGQFIAYSAYSGDSSPSLPMSSTCLRCGQSGKRTATDYPLVGFKCTKCNHFWTKRDRS
jgi:hypothetical protein